MIIKKNTKYLVIKITCKTKLANSNSVYLNWKFVICNNLNNTNSRLSTCSHHMLASFQFSILC